MLARDNGVYAVFSDQVGFDGHSTHVGGAYVLAPDGAMIARTEPGVERALVVADLDPDLLGRVRESPGVPAQKAPARDLRGADDPIVRGRKGSQ